MWKVKMSRKFRAYKKSFFVTYKTYFYKNFNFLLVDVL